MQPYFWMVGFIITIKTINQPCLQTTRPLFLSTVHNQLCIECISRKTKQQTGLQISNLVAIKCETADWSGQDSDYWAAEAAEAGWRVGKVVSLLPQSVQQELRYFL